MSAILTTYTEEGFVIAADGRMSDADDPAAPVFDKAQKIFKIQNRGNQFSMCFCGTVAINAHDDKNKIVWNMLKETLAAAADLENRKTGNLVGLAVRICEPVNQALRRIKRDGLVLTYPRFERQTQTERGNTIARLMLDGYHNGIASRVFVRFAHENDVLLEPEPTRIDLALQPSMIYGSQVIGQMLNGTGEVFSEYRAPIISNTITSAVDWSIGYLKACSDPRAIEYDSICRSIGGRIHVATITTSHGFRWLPGYEPIVAESAIS